MEIVGVALTPDFEGRPKCACGRFAMRHSSGKFLPKCRRCLEEANKVKRCAEGVLKQKQVRQAKAYARKHRSQEYRPRKEWQTELVRKKKDIIDIVQLRGPIGGTELFREFKARGHKSSQRSVRMYTGWLHKEGFIGRSGELTGTKYFKVEGVKVTRESLLRRRKSVL